MKELQDLKKLLIIVDMVNGFVKEGAMADPYITHIIPAQLKVLSSIQAEQEGIAFIIDRHKSGCREFKRYPEHCVEGTKETEVIDELIPYTKEALLYFKNSTSAFCAPHFLEDIQKMSSLQTIITMGCCTDICDLNLVLPLQNYFDQIDRDVEIIVPKDGIETYDAPFHKRDEWNQRAYALMEQAGIQLVKTYQGGNKDGK